MKYLCRSQHIVSGLTSAPAWFVVSLLCLLPCMVGAQTHPAAASPPQVWRGGDVSPPVLPKSLTDDVRSLPRPPAWRPGDPIQEIPKQSTVRPPRSGAPSTPLPQERRKAWDEISTLVPTPAASQSFTQPTLNFDGQRFSGVYPADPVGDVGPQHYLQMINDINSTLVTIYNKSDGTVAAGPFSLSDLGKGECASGHGDPIVLYDQFAERWLISEFSNRGNRLCVYLSRTSDPVTGGWLFYSFITPEFPDYPKYAVWPDAYYVTTNEATGPDATPTLYALDRQRMLRGEAATVQRFTVPSLNGFPFQALTPGDADGTLPPPSGSPGYFIRHRDDEAHNPGQNDPAQDFLELWELRVDFAQAANSTVSGPLIIPVREFDSDLCGLESFECFPQPPGGSLLDPLREVVMWRFQYRNFGTYESLVGNFATDVDGTDHGGIRWFELRKRGTAAWTLFQEGTYAPDDHHRWMASIAMDRAGNLAMGYNVSSATVFPGIRYTGRLRQDPLGTMSQGEITLIDGSGVQSGPFANRWGDYTSLNVDPLNDCTFWYTGAYVPANGRWQTRIGSFVFNECLRTRFVLTGTNLQQEVCAPGDLRPITVEVGQVKNFRAPVTLSHNNLPAGITGTFSRIELRPPDHSLASVHVDSSVAPGMYQFTIHAMMGTLAPQQLPVQVNVITEPPPVASLLSPTDGASDLSVTPSLEWRSAALQGPFVLEIDDDPSFQSIDYTALVTDTKHTPTTALAHNTEYFWRIRTRNACATSSSAVFRFTTSYEQCHTTPKRIPDHDSVGVQTTLQPPLQGETSNLTVSLRIAHPHVGDLFASLQHRPSGITVPLMDQPGVPNTLYGCLKANVQTLFDDTATEPVENACADGPNAIRGNLQPQQPLSAFTDVEASGPWTLTVADLAAEDQGRLLQWCLHFSSIQNTALRGAVSGAQPSRVDCINQTTGETVRITEQTPSWNCTTAGLTSSRGDTIRMVFRGTAGPRNAELVGVAAGMQTTTAVCRNQTAGTSQLVELAGATSWNCTAAGLVVAPGDRVSTTVIGTAR